MLISEGRYRAKLVHVQTENGPVWSRLKQSSGKGTPYLELLVELLSPPHSGEQVYWQAWLSDKAVKRTLENLHAAGMVGDDIRALNLQDLSKEFEVEIQHDTYGRRTTAKVSNVYPVAGVLDMDAIAERVKRIAASNAANPFDVSDVKDGDIPF